jgi:hypothetical protein
MSAGPVSYFDSAEIAFWSHPAIASALADHSDEFLAFTARAEAGEIVARLEEAT